MNDNIYLLPPQSARYPWFSLLIPIEITDDSGIYHLLEHIISRCNDDYLVSGNISGSHIFQASTDYHFIHFYFSAEQPEKCARAILMLLERMLVKNKPVDRKIFETESIRWDSERSVFTGVIYSEVSNFINKPQLLAELSYFRSEHPKSPYGYFNEGHPNCMSRVTTDDVEYALSSIADIKKFKLLTNTELVEEVFSSYLSKSDESGATKTGKAKLHYQAISSGKMHYYFRSTGNPSNPKYVVNQEVYCRALVSSSPVNSFLKKNKIYYRSIVRPFLSGVLFFSQVNSLHDDLLNELDKLVMEFVCSGIDQGLLPLVMVESINFDTPTKCAPLARIEFVKSRMLDFESLRKHTYFNDICNSFKLFLLSDLQNIKS